MKNMKFNITEIELSIYINYLLFYIFIVQYFPNLPFILLLSGIQFDRN